MTTILLLAQLLMQPVGADAAVGASPMDTACPSEVPESRAVVERFLVHPAYSAGRTQVQLGTATTGSIRLLTDAADSAVCQQLNATFGAGGIYGQWRATYFAVGNRYAVVVRRTTADGVRRIGWVPLFVYDGSVNRLATFAL